MTTAGNRDFALGLEGPPPILPRPAAARRYASRMVDMTTHRWWLILLLASVTAGCGYERPFARRPPGSVDYQRTAAQLHDPYPDPDAGPAIVGGRPREFQKPLAEPVRNSWLWDNWWKR